MGFVAFEAVIGMICPLTLWEDVLRSGRAREAGFIERWVGRLPCFGAGPPAAVAISIPEQPIALSAVAPGISQGPIGLGRNGHLRGGIMEDQHDKAMQKLKDNPRSGSSPYDLDFYAWALTNLKFLRAGKFSEADMANIAEELESVGRGEKRELISRLTVLLMAVSGQTPQPQLGCNYRLPKPTSMQ
jgi:Domain of unknown function DUF29